MPSRFRARMLIAPLAIGAVLCALFALRTRRASERGRTEIVSDDAKAVVKRAAIAHVGATCTARFSPDGEADLFDEAIAAAVLERFNPASGTIDPVRSSEDGDVGRQGGVVASCRGEEIAVMELRSRVEVVATSLGNGAALLAEAGIPATMAARVIVGNIGGLCDEPAGFLALVSLRDRTIAVDALAHWEGWACGGSDGSLEVTRWGSSVAILEEGGEHSGEQITNEYARNVWVVRGATLVKVGSVPVSLTQNHAFGDARIQVKTEMSAALEPTARGIVAHETWTFVRAKLRDYTELESIPGERPWTKKVSRSYAIVGDELEREPKDYPTP